MNKSELERLNEKYGYRKNRYNYCGMKHYRFGKLGHWGRVGVSTAVSFTLAFAMTLLVLWLVKPNFVTKLEDNKVHFLWLQAVLYSLAAGVVAAFAVGLGVYFVK